MNDSGNFNKQSGGSQGNQDKKKSQYTERKPYMDNAKQGYNQSRNNNNGGSGNNRYGANGGNFNRQNRNQDQRNQQKRPMVQVFDLSKYNNMKVQIKFSGGRSVRGILKGYDQLQNLVLDEAVESFNDFESLNAIVSADISLVNKDRYIGLMVCRGPSVIAISPLDGSEEIANPFLN
ncbi:Sm-like protein LSM7 [Smittium culicis]|uniref:Sm-like protein LSM7 n=1 Tax=Smittium culicis TaxID=133412 RepID=A0A1R1YL02_9FUNG|nr:Sm-like protein LSM7 [Smittium culicis]